MIGRLTQPIVEIAGIAEITDIAGITSMNLQIRKKKDYFIALLMQRSGARSIVS
jgi:hypothetical protein